MATTCNFGQVKDLRLKSMCMGDITIIDPNRNIYGNNITSAGNVVACNIDAKMINVSGNITAERVVSNCVNSNSVKVKLNGGELSNIAQSQNTIITWQNLEYGYSSPGTNWDGDTRINIYKDGVYHVEATVDWEAFPEGQRNMFMLVNGNIAGSGDVIPQVTTNTNVVQNCSCDISLRQDDYVQLQVFQNATDNLRINPYNLSNLSVRYVHDITSNVFPRSIFSREIIREDPEILRLRREMQQLRREISMNTMVANRNQRLRPFNNSTLARNKLM